MEGAAPSIQRLRISAFSPSEIAARPFSRIVRSYPQVANSLLSDKVGSGRQVDNGGIGKTKGNVEKGRQVIDNRIGAKA